MESVSFEVTDDFKQSDFLVLLQNYLADIMGYLYQICLENGMQFANGTWNKRG